MSAKKVEDENVKVGGTPEGATEGTQETTATTETAETTATAKVYKFQSANKFLTCTALGVQFINGKAETENLEVAKALAKIDGVTLIEK